MDPVNERLIECFRTVFEDLPDDRLETASRTDVAEWDSLATLTLLTVVEEEFDLQLDDGALAAFDSFASVRSLVEEFSG